MKLLKIKPSKSLNKAYYKQLLSREQMELFKRELQNTFQNLLEKYPNVDNRAMGFLANWKEEKLWQ